MKKIIEQNYISNLLYELGERKNYCKNDMKLFFSGTKFLFLKCDFYPKNVGIIQHFQFSASGDKNDSWGERVFFCGKVNNSWKFQVNCYLVWQFISIIIWSKY